MYERERKEKQGDKAVGMQRVMKGGRLKKLKMEKTKVLRKRKIA